MASSGQRMVLPKGIEYSIRGLLVVLFVVLLLRTAWIGDDAYFTMRTVDNFINGYGPTYNVGERVQAYTHPLWMLVLSAVYLFTHEAFYTNLFLSILISAVAFYLLITTTPVPNVATAVLLCVPLLSKAFVEYSTSGLENPLTHLLLMTFLLIFLRPKPLPDSRRVMWMSVIAGLAMLNRMDTILLYAPALLYSWFQERSWRTVRAIAVGFIPIFLWEVFSIIYYGFPFPNPAYAKLGTGISQAEYLVQGFFYFVYSQKWDPITLPVVAAALAFSAFRGSGRQKAVALGVALYFCYVLWIGGDFMSGRYFSGAVLVAVVLFAPHLRNAMLSAPAGLVGVYLVFAYVALVPSWGVYCTPNPSHSEWSIDDSRAFHFDAASLLCSRPGRIEPHHAWALKGLALRSTGIRVSVHTTGYYGYFAGPKVHLVDDFGLADPLLARLPVKPSPDWAIGHFSRRIPTGYVETIETGQNRLSPQGLAQYYDKLHSVISGPLWSTQRFVNIWELNTGQADRLLSTYEP